MISNGLEDTSPEIKTCPECNDNRIAFDYYTRNYVCEGCGLVVDEEQIVTGLDSIRRAYTTEEQDRRFHNYPGRPTGTRIGEINKKLTPKQMRKASDLRRASAWFGSYCSKSLTTAHIEIDRISDLVGIPSYIREDAKGIFEAAMNRKGTKKRNSLLSGRSIGIVAVACIKSAAKSYGLLYTFKQLTSQTNLQKTDVNHFYLSTDYQSVVGEYYNRKNFEAQACLTPAGEPSEPTETNGNHERKAKNLNDPKARLPKITSDIGHPELEIPAMELLETVEQYYPLYATGKSPTGIAAAAVYMAASRGLGKRRGLTQRAIASAAQVTEVTLRNHYKELLGRYRIIIISREA